MPVPLLVFLHGLGQTPPYWQHQVTALPAGTRAVAPWLEGLRPGRPGDFDLDRAADAVLGQLNRFGVDQVALAGAGLGASVAVAAAGRSPAAVSHLVLTDVPPKAPKLAGLVQRLAVLAMPKGRLADAGLDRARMLALVRAASGIDLGHWLPAVTARTLVLAGAADQAGARAASELAGRISGARLETIAGEGADLPRTATAAFNDALYGFLDD
ncbi:alpha/beta fold hydrolase [Micropruina sonneratiae]|uniref:alpha/beta fold hydrolase n=1 Tax=Micropruina sonneratiae TaxID=2986940 RepID=UPI002225C8E9|nr:alpha/beta hydrolase [Micropruina sp. KQZ13P-5]MCW3157062.1 alpha/beta hydrolase [Micropruina sp. KQZ13P-5]